MKKNEMKEDMYKVHDIKRPENELPKWEILRDLNLEIRGSLDDIMKKLITVKTVIEKDLKDSKELMKTLKGTEDVFKEILDRVDLLTKLHTKDVNGKRAFFAGEVKIENDSENSVFIDTLTSYMHLSEMIETFTNVSISTLMSEYSDTIKKEKGE